MALRTSVQRVQGDLPRDAHALPGRLVISRHFYSLNSNCACDGSRNRRLALRTRCRHGKNSFFVETLLSERATRKIKRSSTLTKASGAGEVDAFGTGVNPSSSSSNIKYWSAVKLTSPWDAEIFNLAIPALFSTLLDPIMGVVDTAIVGRLGTEPLAAVGLATIVYNFSNFIWNFLLYTTTPRIAAAASRNDTAQVSAITAQGLWVAACIGCTMTILLWNYCPMILQGMGASPGVLHHAVQYLRGRCIASPAIMMFYVLSGTFRGFKDTRTPLLAGIISNIIHLGLDIALVFGLGWGVSGAALATSLSHWVTLLILGALIIGKGYLRTSDLLTVPSWKDIAPTLRNGALLSTRSILAMSVLMWATKLIAGVGAIALAAHEILRQIWLFSNQAFTCLDIATQSLIAFYLGRGDKGSAADVFRRTLELALFAGVVIAAGLLVAGGSLPAIFSRDAAVVEKATRLIPLVAVYMPLDAAASVMDGVLLGSQEAEWMSRTMIATSMVCGLGLFICQQAHYGLFAAWIMIKMLTVGRLLGNSWRLRSPHSPLNLRGEDHVHETMVGNAVLHRHSSPESNTSSTGGTSVASLDAEQ